MPLSTVQLREASTRIRKQYRGLDEARRLSLQTAFLCHSHKDVMLAEGLVNLLADEGWDLYVDWSDAEMPPKPNRDTAHKIKNKIRELNLFLFLATGNSMMSRWCPWEIGYADGVKDIDKIIVIPTTDDAKTTHGNEYLDLYRHLDVPKGGGLAVWRPNEPMSGIYVRNITG